MLCPESIIKDKVIRVWYFPKIHVTASKSKANTILHMGSVSAASEIVELKEELDLIDHSKRLNPIKVKRREIDVSGKHILPTSGRASVEEELNQLIEAIDLKTRGLRSSHQVFAPPSKYPQKRPIRVGIAQSAGIGITEAVTLKQALRGLCISQASELAALKPLTKSGGLSRASEGGTIKRLSRAVAVEGIIPGPPSGGGDGCSSVEVSVIGDSNTTHLAEDINNSLPALKMGQVTRSNASSPSLTARSQEIPHMELSEKISNSSSHSEDASTEKPLQIRSSSSLPVIECKMPDTLSATHGMQDSLSPSTWSSNRGSAVRKSATSLESIRNSLKNKEYVKKKMNQNLKSASTRASSFTGADNKTSGPVMQKLHPVHLLKNPKKESASPTSSFGNSNIEVSSGAAVVVSDVKPAITLKKPSKGNIVSTKTGRLNSSDKNELSHSSDSSLGECSSSTSISDESSLSILSCGGSRPHMSKDLRWGAIRHIEMQHGNLGLRNFKLLKRLGCGDIGTVYLAELTGSTCLFALKVMDNNFLITRKKMLRAQTEREILQMLDHPFLPTLYTHFTTEKLSCLAMEYCPGGDLHVLRQKQAGRHFSEQAARFYVAEVLLALEYLHMLGVIYRDLKPENILVREDGHIMLSDFDLSLKCAVSPTLLKPSSPSRRPDKRQFSFCSEAPCIDPLCLQPSWSQISCFTPRLLTSTTKTRRLRPESATGQVIPLPQLVAEPTEARSNSFVGTHEYLAPEIIRGEGHGSAVDWWTLGIFLFELLFGITPFKGLGNEETLANVVSNPLNFPESPPVSLSAKDLIRGLLMKEPENRLGFTKGATEIKQHPFFEGLNWALIRCAVPPEIPAVPRPVPLNSWLKNDSKSPKVRSIGDHLKFEVF